MDRFQEYSDHLQGTFYGIYKNSVIYGVVIEMEIVME